MINRKGLFSDESEEFISPFEIVEGQTLEIKFRSLKNNVSDVVIEFDSVSFYMQKTSSSHYYDYFTVRFICPDRKFRYRFLVMDNFGDKVYFNRLGAIEPSKVDLLDEKYSFQIIPSFIVPKWSRGAIYYQIFPDRFCNGNKESDVFEREYYYLNGHSHKVENWNELPKAFDVNNHYGGDLVGVKEKIPYLKDLGIDVINFNPIFISPSNHKYDTQDYNYVDPHLTIIADDRKKPLADWEKHNGYAEMYIKRVTSKRNLEASNEFFAKFVDELHNNNIRVVLDGVFNHCGSFNRWLDREGIYLNKAGYELGAFQSVASPYRPYFKFKDFVAKSEYEGWWDNVTLPKLNYEDSDELNAEIQSVGKKWMMAPFNCDGWRLDVAADLGHTIEYNHSFWREFRSQVKSVKNDVIIFAEHYGDPTSWLSGREWDSVMNYDAFMEPVTYFLTGMEKHSERFEGKLYNNGELFFENITRAMARFPRPSLECALNQLSNHDHSRFLTRTNRTCGTLKKNGSLSAEKGIDKNVMKLGVIMQMTWVGAPGLYYGDEVGVCGWTDPDNRRTYPWGNEDFNLLNFHKKAILVHKNVDAIKNNGSIIKLFAEKGAISYARFSKNSKAVVVVNNNDEPTTLQIPVWMADVSDGKMQVALSTDEAFDGGEVDVVGGNIQLTLKQKRGLILVQ